MFWFPLGTSTSKKGKAEPQGKEAADVTEDSLIKWEILTDSLPADAQSAAIIMSGRSTRHPILFKLHVTSCLNRIGEELSLFNLDGRNYEGGVPGSRWSMQSYTLTYSTYKRGNLCYSWILSRGGGDLNFHIGGISSPELAQQSDFFSICGEVLFWCVQRANLELSSGSLI